MESGLLQLESIFPELEVPIQQICIYYQNRNISNASEANANAANGGEQAADQQMEKSQQQKCHDLATEPIADIKSTVDSLMTKSPGHGSRDYTSEQLTKALEHTNRILGHHLSMCIFKHILEERREQMEQAQKDERKKEYKN
jgi:hypothetical protein